MARYNGLTAIPSNYKYVMGMQKKGDIKIHWYISKYKVGKNGFYSERETAIAVDKYLISKGKEPVNILKRV